MSGRGLRGAAKIGLLAVLVVAGTLATPQSVLERPSKEPEVAQTRQLNAESASEDAETPPETEPEPVNEPEPTPEAETPAPEPETESEPEPVSDAEPEPEPVEETTDPAEEIAEESPPSPEEKIRLITEIVESKFTEGNKATAVQVRENAEYPDVYDVFVEAVISDSGPERIINLVNTRTQEIMETVAADCPSVQKLSVRWELSALLHNRVKEYAAKTYERVWNGDETHMTLAGEQWPDAIEKLLNPPQPEPEPEPAPEPRRVEYTYVLNTNTKKFHYPSCSSAEKIKAANRRTFTGTREEVIAKGYSPCKKCDP